MDYVLANSTQGEVGYEYQPRRSSRQPARLIADLDFALIESSIERAGILLRKLDEHAQANSYCQL